MVMPWAMFLGYEKVCLSPWASISSINVDVSEESVEGGVFKFKCDK